MTTRCAHGHESPPDCSYCKAFAPVRLPDGHTNYAVYLTKGDLQVALRRVRDDARERDAWEYDRITNTKNEAKIELCESLASALGFTLDY